jgi:hypothetical protein
MKSYEEIKEQELETTKDFTVKKMNRYIRFCKIIKSLHSENFFWLISFIPFIVIPGIFIALGLFPLDLTTIFMFLVIHFLYWYFKGRKDVAELINDDIPELELVIKVLDDIRKERENG